MTFTSAAGLYGLQSGEIDRPRPDFEMTTGKDKTAMNEIQMRAACEAMTAWLSHPQELGRAPAKIECAGELDLYDMHYYIFRYKKTSMGKWLIGVCGGYEGDGTEHCGHVFSEMEPYEEDTALEKAVALVETVRQFWMERASEAEEQKENTGAFAGFVLLSEPEWNPQDLVTDLRMTWGIDGEVNEDSEGTVVFVQTDDMMAAVSLMPGPIPDGEAEQNAETNYMWPEAVEAAKAHKAHLLVAVLGTDADLLEKGKLFVKLMACCCNQKRASGVNTSGTVFQPEFYRDFSMMMKEDTLPLFNWIWFGLYRREGGICGYTYGMTAFGMDEMEVLDADAQPEEVRDFLASLAGYVLEEGVTLQDGETIGFSAEDKHAITRSEGISLPGSTLKITF